MGLLTKKLGIQALSLEDPSQPLLPMSALFESLGLGRSDAGVLVNEKQAMRLPVVFAAWKVISEDLAKIPLSVYQTLPDDSVRLAPEHPVHKLIHDEPSPVMTATSFRAALITSALAYGNAFAFINRSKGARPLSLHMLPSDRTSAVVIKGQFCFATTATEDGQAKLIDPENVLHILGLSFDGITGYSPMMCKNAVGIGLASEKYQAQFFGNGARATGVLSHPNHLDAEAYENLKKSVREWATGENALRPIILEEGLKWEQITVNPNDGQVTETRKFQVEEFGRMYRIPLHKLGELSRSTNNNIEHQGIEHMQDALQPWAVKVEQEINRKLLSGYFFSEHDFSELSRGDAISTANSIQVLRNVGLISTNDGLRKLRMNPISKEEGGNVRLVNGANIPLTALVNYRRTDGSPSPASEADSGSEQEDDVEQGDWPTDANSEQYHRISASYLPLFRDAAGRLLNRKKSDASFAKRTLHPILRSLRETLNAAAGITSGLNETDEHTISQLAGSMAEGGEWRTKNARAAAQWLMNTSYGALKHP